MAEQLAQAPGVLEANVYGVPVPGQDGKAGMAALTVDDAFDVATLYSRVEKDMPAYAQPMFIRLQRQIETTGTFKYRKVDLVEDGFDPARTKDPIYFKSPQKKAYVKLTKATYGKLLEGGIKL